MEKVTFAPLLAILKEQNEQLNLRIRTSRFGSAVMPYSLIPEWFADVVEPILSSAEHADPRQIPVLFELLFADLLSLTPAALSYMETVKKSRRVLSLHPKLLVSNPKKIIRSLSSAFTALSAESLESAERWVEKMEIIFPFCDSAAQLLEAGRVSAWQCGMAHLRELIEIPGSLSSDLLDLLFPGETGEVPRLRKWNPGSAASRAVGGSLGFGGNFESPPRVFVRNNQIFASDGVRTWALFADRFGASLKECSFSPPAELPAEIEISPAAFTIFRRYSGVTSAAELNGTLCITESSSFMIFIFGGYDAVQ